MKELLKAPNNGEIRMLFESVVKRDLVTGNLRENDVWMNFKLVNFCFWFMCRREDFPSFA
ncbi:MAG: hypothetical protein WC885_01700 [Candidatus Shapirobacteria bacterium]